jgi:hypothetical protein
VRDLVLPQGHLLKYRWSPPPAVMAALKHPFGEAVDFNNKSNNQKSQLYRWPSKPSGGSAVCISPGCIALIVIST